MDLFNSPEEPPAPAGWVEFWSAYPRKVAKRAALKAFSRMKPSPNVLEQMLRALAIQKEVWLKHGGKDWLRYVPHAATWLNGGRWEDEVSGKLAPAPKGDYLRQQYEQTKRNEPELTWDEWMKRRCP